MPCCCLKHLQPAHIGGMSNANVRRIHENRIDLWSAQLPPHPGRHREGRGSLRLGPRGEALHRHALMLLRAQPGPQAPEDCQGREGPARRADTDFARILQRQARRIHEEAHRARWNGDDAPYEHGRRSGRDGNQARKALGIREEEDTEG